MNIDLSAKEVELIEEALKEWQNVPATSGMLVSLVGTMVRPKAPPGFEEVAMERMKREARDEIEVARLKVVERERRALLLRAKLVQALARQSEHTLDEAR